MIGAHQRSSSNHSTYERFKSCGETQKLSERLVSTGTSIHVKRTSMVAGMRTESESLKGKDGRKRRSVAINLGAEQERSTKGIKSFWRSSALCSAANIYRLFTACGRAKKCVSRQYRRKALRRVRR